MPAEHEVLLPASSSSSIDGMPSDVAASKREARPGDSLALASLLTGLALFVGASWWIVIVEGPSLSWFSGHPTGQSLGIALIIVAIGQLQPTATPSSKAKGLKLHQSLVLLLALPALAAGSGAMYYNKALHSAPHFTTWHATFGVATFAVILLQVAFGLVTVTPSLSALLGGPAKAKRYWKYHRALGYVLVASLLLTAHLGGAHSTWALSSTSLVARIAGFWFGLPLVAVGLYARLRPSKLGF